MNKKTDKIDDVKHKTVRMSAETFKLVEEIAKKISTHGWRAFGLSRDTPCTLTAVVEEAVTILKARER